MLKLALTELYQQNFTTIYLGFSGGVDSSVLLAACHELSQENSDKFATKIIAVHINHRVNSNSDLWQQHCQQQCTRYKIPLKTYQLNLKLKTNFEAIAREARYKVFADLLQTNQVLLTAQHQDDQVETVLLRLLRGSGPVGLAAMPTIRNLGKGKLIRPWLNIPKVEIMKYAHAKNLSWLEDDSNLNDKFDRNFLRNQVIPMLASRWPSLNKTISRSANLCRQTIENIHQSETKDYLAISQLQGLTATTASNKVYWWLRDIAELLPSQTIISKIVSEVAFAQLDAIPQISWQFGQVRRYKNCLYFLAQPQNITLIKAEYSLQDKIYLPECECTLINQTQHKLLIRFPQGGEVIKLNGQHKKLKKIFQQQQIKPWLRHKTPLVFVNGKLIQVVGICQQQELVKCQ